MIAAAPGINKRFSLYAMSEKVKRQRKGEIQNVRTRKARKCSETICKNPLPWYAPEKAPQIPPDCWVAFRKEDSSLRRLRVAQKISRRTGRVSPLQMHLVRLEIRIGRRSLGTWICVWILHWQVALAWSIGEIDGRSCCCGDVVGGFEVAQKH